MFCWRITKYNPKNRDNNGVYTKNEWTSYSDIGISFDDQVLTIDDYITTENAYIAAIKMIMKSSGAEVMQIVSLQKNLQPTVGDIYSAKMITTYRTINENDFVIQEEIEDIARLALRENLWCKLESATMYIYFGYDYYMYVGSTSPCKDALIAIEKEGLFVEEFKSPY